MLYLLYLLLTLMFLCAIALLSIVYFRNPISFSRSNFLTLILFVALFSFSIYRLGSHHHHLKKWLVYGKRQYDFLIEYERLGGINGMIMRIQHKLEDNPTDLQAWVILGKLYIAKTDYPAAKEAFDQAHKLQPRNSEINHYLDIATNPANYALL